MDDFLLVDEHLAIECLNLQRVADLDLLTPGFWFLAPAP